VDAEQKESMNAFLSYGYPGASHAYGVLPFVDKNGVQHYKIMDVPAQTGSGLNAHENVEASIKAFSDYLAGVMASGVSDPPPSLVPPEGTLYRIMPTSIFASLGADLSIFNKSGSQTFSYRIDNTFFNYRENGNGEDGYVLLMTQDGLVSPGTPIINNQNDAIGFFQDTFSIVNTPKPFDKAPTENFYWSASNPATVDQTHSETSTVSTTVSTNVDMAIGGSGNSTVFTALNSVSSAIDDWGINENSVGPTSVTGWTYHMQFPYDPYNLLWKNFGQWWKSAYNGNNVNGVPDLSLNTLQVHTVSVWYADGSLRSPQNTLPVNVYTVCYLEGAIVANPGWLVQGHHECAWTSYSWNFKPFQMDMNSFPNKTSSN